MHSLGHLHEYSACDVLQHSPFLSCFSVCIRYLAFSFDCLPRWGVVCRTSQALLDGVRAHCLLNRFANYGFIGY